MWFSYESLHPRSLYYFLFCSAEIYYKAYSTTLGNRIPTLKSLFMIITIAFLFADGMGMTLSIELVHFP